VKTPSDILVLRTPAQLRAILPPVRVEIVERLKNRTPQSIAELAQLMDYRPNALTYHVNRLVEAGVLVNEKTRRTNGRTEALYRLSHERLAVAAQVGQKAQFLTAAVSAGLRLAQRELAAAIEHGFFEHSCTPVTPGQRMRARLTKSDEKAVHRKLKEIQNIFASRRDMRSGKPFTFTCLLIPLSENKKSERI